MSLGAACIVLPLINLAALLDAAKALTPRSPQKALTTGMTAPVMQNVFPDPPGPCKNKWRGLKSKLAPSKEVAPSNKDAKVTPILRECNHNCCKGLIKNNVVKYYSLLRHTPD